MIVESEQGDARFEFEDDVAVFTEYARSKGWGDGLPLVPPTEARVEDFVARSGRKASDVVALLPPRFSDCTVEKVAANAVMAGAPPEAMPLILAALEAMSDEAFNLSALNATTGTVVPAVIVNGPIRHDLDISYERACFGGKASNSPSIGRAIRLVIRNVAGQEFGVTSKSVFGQPGLVTGIVVAEWEERSPWPPLAEQRGVAGDAVTVYPSMGTKNIADHLANDGAQLLEVIGKGMVHVGANGVALAVPGTPYCEAFVAINPVWAAIIGKEFPKIEDVKERLWQHASLPVSYFPQAFAEEIPKISRYHDGRLYLAESPDVINVIVCGGSSSIHAMTMPSWGDSRTITRPVTGTGPS